MQCFYCRRKLGFARKLVDSRFCSDEHRRNYHDQQWSDELAIIGTPASKGRRGLSTAAAIFGLLACGLLLFTKSRGDTPSVVSGAAPASGGRLAFTHTATKLHEDFTS